jgi:D-tyrosyl-tRNA(Tyr) deacylase
MNRCILDCAGSALIVSQFTLAANTSKGNRPSFIAAAAPDHGEQLYEQFCHAISNLGIPVATGQFGADMQVELINDGPVTIPLEIAATPL